MVDSRQGIDQFVKRYVLTNSIGRKEGPYQPPSTSRQAFSDLPCQVAYLEPSVPSLPFRTNAPSPRSARLPGPPLVTAHRKQCIVAGCQEYIAPTMWRSHMNLHAQGVFPGEVPTWWLEEQDLSVCTHCLRLVAMSHFASHLEKCPTNVSGCRSSLPSSLADSSPSENPIHALPSLDVVCELQCPTIRYIPHKARPVFARVLSDVLKSICYENSEEAWLRLPKCVLRASRRGGRHCTACGPSGLRIQHLLDAAQVHLPTPICSSLRGVVDILASGRAPVSVSKFLAGGSLTALVKNKEGRPLDIRPIVVGEALRRLTGSVFALLEECAVHFPELLPWVGWCYGSHPTLWHPLGQLSSETGVQQGDPLGPLLFSLVLHKLVLSIAQDKDCLSLLSNRWYLDDGVLSGHSQAVTRAVTLIQEMGPSLGLFINVSKCELFRHGDLSSFPPEMKVSRVPNLEILGAPIGDPIFCAKFLAQKCADGAKLLSQLAEEVRSKLEVFLVLTGCILVNNWHLGKPAAFDLTVTSLLNPTTLTEAGVRCGSSALFAEARKHNANDSKCAELGWVCIPLAVESYRCWGTEAQQSFSRLAARLAIQMGCSKSQATRG
eukprot:Em0033g10a